MKTQNKYEYIVSADICCKFDSIYKPKASKYITYKEVLLNVIVLLVFTYDALYSHLLIIRFSIISLVVIELLILLIVMLPAYYINYSRNMKLIITNNGIALYPNKFLARVPIYRLIAEKWADIEFYSIYELQSLLKIGSDERKKFYLYIRTKGIIPRCVNNYGISVFAITGHHLNEADVQSIRDVLNRHGVLYKEIS